MGGASRFLMLLTTPLPFLCLRPSALRLARHSRAALAAASSSTSVPLYRLSSPLLLYQSRRRAGFAVRAGESIHTQASVRDDYGERLESPAAAARSWNQWPEWSRLVEHVMAGGYASRSPSLDVADAGDDDSFAASYELPEEFLKAAYACLSFSRDRPVLLKLLSKKDIKTVVKNGSPFLFKNALNSSRRMEIFIDSDASSVLEYERARTVDLMRYLLSYAYNRHFSSGKNNLDVPEAVVASFQNLLNEVVVLSGTVQEPFDSTNRMTTWSSEHSSRLPRQNIEMKRGDWICPRCNFMNFANNIKCRECDEVRPKRQLTGGEWECPQCDFFNYGRNMACLRCDCKRPGEIANTSGHPGPKANLGIIGEPSAIISGNNSNKSDIEHRIAENEEKAERWFSKVSQLDDSSDLSSAIADEDFPEIMPLRKGENRFVVSTRKTPLERRLANAQYRKTLVGDGPVGGNEMLSGNATDKTYDSSISRRLDRILGNAQPVNRDIPKGVGDEINSAQRDPSFVPFVPLPADMFREPHTSKEQQQASDAVNANQAKGSVAGSNGEKEASNPSSTFAERHDAKNSASPISDDDFPDIMPLRKGENRFVVSKKKDRSLTSPQYKRRLAMEQANGSNFVPFVPFPPGYFAKKDHQPEVGSSTVQAEMVNHDGIVHGSDQNMPGKLEEAKHDNPRKTASDIGNVEISQAEQSGNVEYTGRNWSKEYKNSEPYYSNSWDNKNQNQSSESSLGDCSGRMNTSGGSSQQPSWDKNKENWDGGNSQGGGFSSRNIGGNSAPQAWDNSSDRWSSRPSQGSNYSGMNVAGISNPPSWNDKDGSNSSSWGNTSSANAGGSSTPQSERSQSSRESSWGFSGKSLEGSAVTEPDPLDMSEEAKAQRWFRRVAQITDISELSKIPDEDFPEIMPMRKGVNRFVVSKRKTPLERRLTSPQYRRNLPIVSSEPEKISKPEINSNQDKF